MKKRYLLTFKTVSLVISDVQKSFTCEDYDFIQKEKEAKRKIENKLKRLASLISKESVVIHTDVIRSYKTESS